MRKKAWSLFLCVVLISMGFSLSLFSVNAADVEITGAFEPDNIVIGFYDRSMFPDKEKQYDDEVAKVLKDGLSEIGLNMYLVRSEDFVKNPNATLNRYKNSEFVEFCEPNYIMNPDSIPNDPNYRNQSAVLTAINAQAGWEIVTGGGPIVAVIDSGVAKHADLPALLPGFSSVTSLAANNDKLGHGTGVAGTIGAIGNNGLGGTGINWNAKILPVKVDDAYGKMSVANVAKGIIWAADNGAKVINLSLGTSSDSTTLKNAVNYAYNKGCALFAAAGNESASSLCYPARYANVMAVGASASGRARALISNYGPGMGVVAITSYYTTSASGGFGSMSGTSFSTPQVAGLASLVWAVNPNLSNDDIYSLIQQGAKPLGGGYNEETGYGLIDIAKTLQLAKDLAAPEPEVEVTEPEEEEIVETPVTEPEGEPIEVPSTEAPEAKPDEPEPDPAEEGEAPTTEEPTEEPPQYTAPPTLTLVGFAEIRLYVEEEYVESGYTAVDCLGVDLTGAVKVTDNINIWTPGLYTVHYEVEDAGGNKARATRTVIIEEREVPPPPAQSPTLTIIGSNPIILHLGGSAYTEQGAHAYDDIDGDISAQVRIDGQPDLSRAGTYTIQYSVVNSAGLEATATRDVRILAPTETRLPRTPYSFSGQGKVPTTNTHTGIVCEEAGFMDFRVSNIGNKTTVAVRVMNADTGASVYSNSFNGVGGTQFWADEGRYQVEVAITAGNGNCSYAIELLTPEAILVDFAEKEVPLTELGELELPVENEAPASATSVALTEIPSTFDHSQESMVFFSQLMVLSLAMMVLTAKLAPAKKQDEE